MLKICLECESSLTTLLFETSYICSIYRSKGSVCFVLALVCCVSYIIRCLCVCLCMCSYVHVFLHTCLHACKWGRTDKVLVCAGRHKARPPIPLFLFPGGEIRQSVYLPDPSRRGGWGPEMGGYRGGGVGTV